MRDSTRASGDMKCMIRTGLDSAKRDANQAEDRAEGFDWQLQRLTRIPSSACPSAVSLDETQPEPPEKVLQRCHSACDLRANITSGSPRVLQCCGNESLPEPRLEATDSIKPSWTSRRRDD
ncbi:hypothetical protein ON010_g5686 [Phytophthora cinnamomi]|nr:hypothetical protein ON010_g5686 [Phytophthora cinnamomi]